MRPDIDDPGPKLFGLEVGTVVDRDDPRGLGRVRVMIPGVIEPKSAWAFPLGVPGGGSKDRGFFDVPELGSEVGVLFKRGDVDHPYYMPANWGAPGGEKDSPDATDGGDPDVKVLAMKDYDIVVDTRGETKKFRIVDKSAPEDNIIEFDGARRTLQIKATTAVQIESVGQVDIRGLVVSINGVVAGDGKL